MSDRSSVATVRQFARAAFADRLIGDEIARVALATARYKPHDHSSAREFVRAFLRVWKEAAEDRKTGAPQFSDRSLLESVPAPPPEEQLLLLLVDVIGFSLHDGAWILAPLTQAPSAVLELGRRHVAKRRSADALIIEDEPLIAADLREIVAEMGVNVPTCAATVSDAFEALANLKPDIILADYNLGDQETGVDAVRRIQDIHSCPIIFITGFPDKVLSGEDVEPDFVISKPFTRESVRAAVAHCLDRDRTLIPEV